jgi:hypothetical protein
MFQLASLVYAFAALATLWRLLREWRALLDDVWTPRDSQLAQMIGFLLLTPFAVWLHEWGHAAAMRLYGATDPQIHFFLYWGYVTSGHGFTPAQHFVVALAGPLVTYVLGWALLAVALLLPMRPAVALALAMCAVMQLLLVLLFYPAASLLGGWGDFSAIYLDDPSAASVLVGIAHVVSLVAFLRLMSLRWMQGFMDYPVPRPWRLHWVAPRQ